jgi:hypothetical protein
MAFHTHAFRGGNPMKKPLVAPGLVMMLAAAAALAARAGRAPGAPALEISGPYTHANLAVFLVHGPDAAPGRTFLTLEEALAAKKAIVRETGSVNELAIENLSPDEDVYVQAGDIVRGGQQDRTIEADTVVAHGTSLPLASFCVEHGRWTQRGAEAADRFESAANAIATKDLKKAVMLERSQGKVWQEVEAAQKKLEANLGAPVADAQSKTSLELALDNDRVRGSADEYVRALATIVERRKDVVGYAFAIDGKVNSADVYASGALFRKLWPKLLRASAVEAVAGARAAAAPEPPAKDAILAFFADADAGKRAEAPPAAATHARRSMYNGQRARLVRAGDAVAARQAAPRQDRAVELLTFSDASEIVDGEGAPAATPPASRVEEVRKESERNVLIESRDRGQGGAWIHRTYLVR